MSQIKRKHIEDQAINSTKIDPSDTYTINGLIVDTTSVTGSIGVGTASPQAGVHIKRVTTSAGMRLDLDDGASGKSYEVQSLPAGSFSVKDIDAASYRLIIDTTGAVGIGKTLPEQRLHIYNGGASAYIAAERSTGTAIFGSDSLGTCISESASRPIYFNTNSLERMRITGNKVGIGNSNPTYTLSVDGTPSKYADTTVLMELNNISDAYSVKPSSALQFSVRRAPGLSAGLGAIQVTKSDDVLNSLDSHMTFHTRQGFAGFIGGEYKYVERMRLDATGNLTVGGKVGIGIGTSNTLYISDSGILSSNRRGFLFEGSPSGSGLKLICDNGRSTRIRSTAPVNSSGSSTLYLENTYIDNDDNTSINSIVSMTYDVDATYGIFNIPTSNEFLVGDAFRVDSTNNITITGSVGIGTYNPSTINKLHIDGGSLWLTGGNTDGSPDASVGLRLCYDVAGDKGHIFSWDYTNGGAKDTVFDFGDIYSVPLTDYSGTSVLSGWDTTAGLVIEVIQYRRLGALCDVFFTITGESNGSFTDFTLPYNAKNIPNFNQFDLFIGRNDSTPLSTNGMCFVYPGSNRLIFSSSPGYGITGSWTASGTKSVAGKFRYEIEL